MKQPIGNNRYVNLLFEIPKKWLTPDHQRVGSVVFRNFPDGRQRIVGHLEELGGAGTLSKMAIPSALPPIPGLGKMSVSTANLGLTAANLGLTAMNLGLTAFLLYRMEKHFKRLFKELEEHKQILQETQALVIQVLEEMDMDHKANVQSALELIRHAMNTKDSHMANDYLLQAKHVLNKERQFLSLKSQKVVGNAFLADADILRILYLTGMTEAEIEMRLGNPDNAIDIMESAATAIHAHTENMLASLIGPHPAWWLNKLEIEESMAFMAAFGQERVVRDIKENFEFGWDESSKVYTDIHRNQWRSSLNYLAGTDKNFDIEHVCSHKAVWKRMNDIFAKIYDINTNKAFNEALQSVSRLLEEDSFFIFTSMRVRSRIEHLWIRVTFKLMMGVLETRQRFTGLKMLFKERPDVVRWLLDDGLKDSEDKPFSVLDLEE